MPPKKNAKKSSQKTTNAPSGSNNHQQLNEHEIKMILLEEEQIDKLFSTLSLKRKPIAKDGGCLFRAFSDLYFGTQVHHKTVRKACVEYMKEHEEFYRDFIFEMEFNAYLKHMSKPSSWGSQIELSVLSKLYKVNITVYNVNGIVTELTGYPDDVAIGNQWNQGLLVDLVRKQKEKIEPRRRNHLIFAFLHGSHYDSVYPSKEFMNTIIMQDVVYDTFLKPFETELFTKKEGSYKNVEFDAWLDELELIEKKSLQKVRELLSQSANKSYDLSDAKEFPELAKHQATASKPTSEPKHDNENGEEAIIEKPQNPWLVEKKDWSTILTQPVEQTPETTEPVAEVGPKQEKKDVGIPLIQMPSSLIAQSHSLTVEIPAEPAVQPSKSNKKSNNKKKNTKPANSQAKPSAKSQQNTTPKTPNTQTDNQTAVNMEPSNPIPQVNQSESKPIPVCMIHPNFPTHPHQFMPSIILPPPGMPLHHPPPGMMPYFYPQGMMPQQPPFGMFAPIMQTTSAEIKSSDHQNISGPIIPVESKPVNSWAQPLQVTNPTQVEQPHTIKPVVVSSSSGISSKSIPRKK